WVEGGDLAPCLRLCDKGRLYDRAGAGLQLLSGRDSFGGSHTLQVSVAAGKRIADRPGQNPWRCAEEDEDPVCQLAKQPYLGDRSARRRGVDSDERRGIQGTARPCCRRLHIGCISPRAAESDDLLMLSTT